ncbi:acyl-CoA thioesterase [Heliorestis acidaminivorans]|uniref:Acyl-CoA thioesterase n=1 Tax=Heliorestis acidaminivorans TaxID=553427 RepID=A0A6I0F3I4_9FIRM|nr:acyl-CoA thioesterase [Heliorestis acidaminivorans]KAB2954300.1 acyl-CoA thioesterase [Heliorestis acidaminivorans]
MEPNAYQYELAFQVRDYECDLQGIVNNAVYLNYLEHARHEFMHEKGIDFAALHKEGKDLVVVRMEVDYKHSLTSRDRFVVRIKVSKESRLKTAFYQTIYRLPDEKVVLKAKVVGVCLQQGKPVLFSDIDKLIIPST